MRFLTLSIVAITALFLWGAAVLSAQEREFTDVSQAIKKEQENLENAKRRNQQALNRSNILRNQASETNPSSRRFNLQKQAINADIMAARANLDAARARIAIITQRQSLQQRRLAQQTSPILRLMGALENMTRRPATMMLMQPQSLDDYVHLRAVMASVQPQIAAQTAGLRGQIDLQKTLRDQQKIALASLDEAQEELNRQQASLAGLEAGNVDGALNEQAALEFEKAIIAGERARDIVENIDNIRDDDEVLSALSRLDGPKLRSNTAKLQETQKDNKRDNKRAYIIPQNVQIASGFGELSETGYRERGIRMMVPPSSDIMAPASGVVKYADIYRNFGQIIIIEHGGGWATLITNLASLNVAKGQKVDQNSIVGTSKNSARNRARNSARNSADNNDNAILIELRRNGRPMDIMALVLQ